MSVCNDVNMYLTKSANEENKKNYDNEKRSPLLNSLAILLNFSVKFFTNKNTC